MPTGQRKKTAKANDSTTTSTDISLTDQLDRAQAAVESSRLRVLTLHSQWRTHLLRLSYVVMMVTFHSMQAPTTSCIKEIKHWNEIKRNSMEEPITGFQAFLAALNDSYVEVLSVFCGGFLVWCLSLSSMENTNYDYFATLPYRLSCAVIPLIVSLYFQNKHLGCIPPEEKQHIEDDGEIAKRPFPIILVFHTIVSISLFFMQYQRNQQEENVAMVEKMRKDLLEARQSKKKS